MHISKSILEFFQFSINSVNSFNSILMWKSMKDPYHIYIFESYWKGELAMSLEILMLTNLLWSF